MHAKNELLAKTRIQKLEGNFMANAARLQQQSKEAETRIKKLRYVVLQNAPIQL